MFHRYGEEEQLTPLAAAAKAGKHEIVAYLLRSVTAEGVRTEEVSFSTVTLSHDARLSKRYALLTFGNLDCSWLG